MSQLEPDPVSLTDVVAIRPDVIFRIIEGEAVLLHPETGNYFDLNGTGTYIWNVLSENGSLELTHSRLVRDYDIEPEIAEEDLLKLTSELIANGLVSIVRTGAGVDRAPKPGALEQ